MMQRLFGARSCHIYIDVQTGGSSRGINDARSGLANIGMASRALKENETDLLSFTIALDGISMIINQANPISSLDKQQIIDIYTGKIINWQQVGGNVQRSG
jgi:phosphate transport system substrate-binding protein